MRDYLREMRDHYEAAVSAGDPSKKKVDMSFCPSTWNKPCRLCDHCKEVLFHQDKYSAQEIEQAREFNRKPKFYANVLLVTNPTEVLVFEYGKTIGDKLGIHEMDDSSELRGFSHPATGRNMIIVRFPNPDKRKTRYDVEPRLAVTPIPDSSVLQRLYNLDDIPALLKGGLQPLYQSKLTAQRTELRWLPSWLGPQYASVFQVRYFIHYHTSEEELAAICRGEFNPLAVTAGPEPGPFHQEQRVTIPEQAPKTGAPSMWKATILPYQPQPRTDLWSDLQQVPNVGTVTQAPAPTQLTRQGVKPGCFGTFDEQEPICSVKCAEKGWVEECKVETEANLAKRRQARGLYR